MKALRILLFLFALLFAFEARAATCFWVGGTGNYDSVNVASWASGTGGTPSTCAATGGIPKNAGDVATFDGASGGGTVTVCGASSVTCPSSSGNLNTGTVSMGAFTGTLDFATNNPIVTLTAFLCTGTSTRTLNMGSGTWTITTTSGTPWSCATTTNMTLNGSSSTLLFNGTSTGTRTISLGGTTGGTNYGNVTISNSSANAQLIDLANGGAFTIAGSLTLTNIRNIRISAGVTHTVTGAFVYDGTTNAPSLLYTNGTAGTFSVGAANTWTWIVPQNITKAGAGSITVNNGFDGGGNTNVTVNNPVSGGGRCIGC